jgi:nicotinamidase-related amidase
MGLALVLFREFSFSGAQSWRTQNSSIGTVAAEPGPIELDWSTTALVIIDMQRDFMEPGGFGETLGNDVSQLARAVEADRGGAGGGARQRHAGRAHPRGPFARSVRRAAGEGRARRAKSLRIGDPGPMGRILIRGEAGHDIIPALYPLDSEIVIDKPGKGAFYATELGDVLQKYGIENLLVCGVTTEVCVNTTVREANDRGYRCVVLSDGCASYFPEFHEMGLKMIKAQGGIFGWVSDSAAVLQGNDTGDFKSVGSGRVTMSTSTAAGLGFQAGTMDARRLECLLRLRHQHSGQHAGADGAVALRAEDAGQLVFGRILPALGLMMCLSTFYYAWLAYRLAQKTGRTDVCALPSGISVPHMFIVTFVIMLPVTIKTGDPMKGWSAGLVWVFFQSFILMIGGFIAPYIRQITPRAALLGTLAGVSVTFISMRPALEMYMTPQIGLICFAIIMVSWFGGVKYFKGIPAGLVAIAVGMIIAWGSNLFGLGLGGIERQGRRRRLCEASASRCRCRPSTRYSRASNSSASSW